MAIAPTRSPQERELLDAARAGDEDAFRRIVEPLRGELHAHCYRMLGSVQDAEDALQEALLRAWRGLPGFEGRSSTRGWLYRIATNTCLDAIARRPKRVLPIDYGPDSTPSADFGPPLVESVWIEPYPDETLGVEDGYAAPDARYEQREAVELAFIAALQHLPPRQRAVLILREVLGFSAREVSDALSTTVASVNSALQRARRTIDDRLPAKSQQTTLREVGDARMRELVEAYVDAWARGDVDAVRALLVEDAILSMPPWPIWWRGRETISSFVGTAVETCPEARSLPIRANGQLAMAHYNLDDETGRFLATAIEIYTFEGERIKEAISFVTPDAFARFGLPAEYRA